MKLKIESISEAVDLLWALRWSCREAARAFVIMPRDDDMWLRNVRRTTGLYERAYRELNRCVKSGWAA